MYRSNSNPYTIFITITFAEVNWVSHPFVKDSIVKKKFRSHMGGGFKVWKIYQKTITNDKKHTLSLQNNLRVM